MDLRDVEAVMAVHEYGSYFEAAFQINVSRTTLSRKIAHLENEIGIKIFSRATKTQKVFLTEDGHRLIPLFRTLLQNEADILCLCDELNHNQTSVLNIGFRPSFFAGKRRDLISGFVEQYPEYDVIARADYDNNLINSLLSGANDCILLPVLDTEIDYFRGLVPTDKYAWVAVYGYNQLRLGVALNSELCKYEKITKKDFPILEKYTFIFDAINMDKHPDVLSSFLGLSKMKKRFLDFSDPEIVANLVKTKGGILPQMIGESRARGINFVPVEGYPYTVSIYLIFKKDNPSRALRAFSNYSVKQIARFEDSSNRC